jgi:hypothetical protein
MSQLINNYNKNHSHIHIKSNGVNYAINKYSMFRS